VGWHGLARSRIRYPLLANAVQRLLTVWLVVYLNIGSVLGP
jgi:hypothetical protein